MTIEEFFAHSNPSPYTARTTRKDRAHTRIAALGLAGLTALLFVSTMSVLSPAYDLMLHIGQQLLS